MYENLARVRLAQLPTPLYELPRLSEKLGGPRIVVKRDDLTGLAGGGNKARKLEFLIADALAEKANVVITAGAAQSNHARQTAAAAARYGLRAVLVLGPKAPTIVTGNLLIDHLVGAHIRWAGDRDRHEVMQDAAAEERGAGRTPYIIPYGGSNAIGAGGYVLAMEELARQCSEQQLVVDHIVVASSSGGTQAGMVTGARAANLGGRVLGISIDKSREELSQLVLDLARLTAAHLDLRFEIAADSVEVADQYVGEGYGVFGEPEREALSLVARTEGLILDPVYTGRAMAGLIDLIRRGEFERGETVLFWHTGGAPALYAYAEEILHG